MTLLAMPSTRAVGRAHAKGAGRPSKLTPETQDLICSGIARGLFTEHAVKRAGVSTGAYYDWMAGAKAARAQLEAGEDLTEREERFLQFAEAVERAEAESEALLVSRILDAGQPRKDRRITITEEPLRERGRLVRDGSGEPMYVTTSQVEERDVLDCRPNLELLKRRFPDRWGDKQHAELTGPDGGPVEVVQVTDVERRLAARLTAFRAKLPASLMEANELAAAGAMHSLSPSSVDDGDDYPYLLPWSTLDYDVSE